MTTFMFLAFFLATIPSVEAKVLDVHGGVQNEYVYEEVFFLTGKPIKFTGKATVTERESKDRVTTTHKFSLTSGTDDKLTRTVMYETVRTTRDDKGQTTSSTSVKSFSEKVTIGKMSYTLDDYQLSQASISDNRPASDFYSGNLVGRKIYKVNNTNELVTVHLTGRNMGYENFWGATETQLVDYEIESALGKAFIKSKVSDSKSKTLQYEPHMPDLSSFVGGYVAINSSNTIGEYTYDIPYGSGKGTVHLSKENVPIIERLIVPKFRDLSGNWAKDHIERLYSLGIFEESSPFFAPNVPMNRYEFTVGVLKAVNLRVLEQPKNQKVPRTPIFKDLDPKDPDYLLIESAVEKGIIKKGDYFKPKASLTRVQATAILIRALGMEGRAPSPGYQTRFLDDSQIESWAKDSVYMGSELGLIQGSNHYFLPYNPLTRAQASALIIRFLDFMENDLKQNYRDDVLFFN